MPDTLTNSAANPENLIGQSIGPYKVASILAIGKRAFVYLARHKVMGRECVLKITPPRISMHEKMLERFRREIRITSTLHHPNIIEFYDAGKYSNDDRIYLVMEHFDGVDLAMRFKEQPAPLEMVVAIGMQVASALNAAHACDVVHREIEPENILVNPRGLVKVVDFGIAKAYAESTGKGLTDPMELLGNPAFMAPEQVWAADNISARADIYGLGAVLYFCLTGQPPYNGGSPMEIIQQIGSGVEPLTRLRPDIPVELSRIIEKAMQQEPDERFDNAEAMYRALEQVPVELPDLDSLLASGDSTPSGLPESFATGFLSVARAEQAAVQTPPPAKPYLRIFGPRDGCWEYRLEEKKVTIGRNQEMDIVLDESYVSRHHATIHPAENGKHLLEDNDSRAGLTVNGDETSRVILNDGDTIQIGHYILQYRVDGKYVSDQIKHFPLNFLPTSMDARYRIVYNSPSKVFAPGDTLPIGRGGIYIPVQIAPADGVCVEVELTWPNKKKRTFLAEILGTLPQLGMLLMCLKLHAVNKDKYELLVKRSRRGVWAVAPKV